jgi:uncharacterized membrane protein YphA (DoxX/SURF4 family)
MALRVEAINSVLVNTERLKLLLRFLLAGVFIFSAISKLLSVGLFEITIVEQGIFSTRAQAAYPARILIAFEFFLGASLLFPFFLKRIFLPLAIAMLAAFTVLQVYQLTFGEQTQDCGCFGELIKMSSTESLLKNIILLGLSIHLWRTTREEKRSVAIPSILVVASVAAVLLLAPVRGNYDGNFAQYTKFEKAGLVDLTSGDKLVAVFNAECEHCQETARELSALAAKNSHLPKIYVLMFSESDSSVSAFSKKTDTDYPYHAIAEDEFFDLIGNSPPRIYWLQDGKIKAQWDDEFAKNILTAFNIQTNGKS